MEDDAIRREYGNLYRLFFSDRQAHSMPPEQAETVRKKILEVFSEKIKPADDVIPPR